MTIEYISPHLFLVPVLTHVSCNVSTGPYSSIAINIHPLPYNMVDASDASALCIKAHEACAALSKFAHSQHHCKHLAHHGKFDVIVIVGLGYYVISIFQCDFFSCCCRCCYHCCSGTTV